MSLHANPSLVSRGILSTSLLTSSRKVGVRKHDARQSLQTTPNYQVQALNSFSFTSWSGRLVIIHATNRIGFNDFSLSLLFNYQIKFHLYPYADFFVPLAHCLIKELFDTSSNNILAASEALSYTAI